jgi:diguanylate cyclase (GGDEF)-like protein
MAGLAVVYYVTATLGLRLAYLHPSASPVWAPSGIALAAFLVWGRRVWPAVFVAAYAVNLSTAGNLVTSGAIAVGNTLEGVVGALLVRRFATAHGFDRVRDVLAFVFLAAGLSTMISATVGVGGLSLGGFAVWADFGPIWLTWWMGDASGILIVTPFLLLWARGVDARWSRATLAEAAALTIGVVAAGQLIFGGVAPDRGPRVALEFLSVPLLLWAAMRFTPREAATATLLLSVVAVRGTLLGSGPFARIDDPNEALVLVQSFLVVSAATTLILAAVVAERRRSMAELLHLSESDGLTGLANFRHLHEVIDQEIRRSARTERPFSLLLMDLNELKAINDRHGHLTGNRAICRVAEAMRMSCRAVDTAARFGGDEFAVVLPETGLEEAWAVADRIHDRLYGSPESPALSLCVGVSEHPRDGRSREALFEHADRTLYAMKRAVHGEHIRTPQPALETRPRTPAET